MSDAVIMPDWDAQFAAARARLARAETDEARADAYISECLVHLEHKRSTLGADGPSIRAARVARGRLSEEQAAREVLRLSNTANAHFDALVGVVSTELLLRIPRAYFGANTRSERVVLARLVREGRIADAFAFSLNGRLDDVSYETLASAVDEATLASARRTLDARNENIAFDLPVAGGDAAYQRLYALQRLVTRTRLEPLETRAPWFDRCQRAIDANAATIAAYAFGGDVRALFVLALVEAGDVERAVDQFARVAVNVVPYREGEAIDATIGLRPAFDALARVLTPEARIELEASLVGRFDRPETTTCTWLALSKMLSGARSASCAERVVRAYERAGGDRLGTWIDELPRSAYAERIPAFFSAFELVAKQHSRGGRAATDVLTALRGVPADGPFTEKTVALLRAWGEHPTRGIYAHELVLRWLCEATRRGSDAAFEALVSFAKSGRSWWTNYESWFRVLDANRVDVLLDAHRTEVAPWTFQSWTTPLQTVRGEDRASLQRFFGPRVLRATVNPVTLGYIEAYTRPEDEHALVCRVLDEHAKTMEPAWAYRLVSLANILANEPLAHKCIERYCANTSPPTWKRDQLASAVVRLSDEARAERALARGISVDRDAPWIAPRTRRVRWLLSLDPATAEKETAGLWTRVHIASVGLVRTEADRAERAALSHAYSALVRHRLFGSERRASMALERYGSTADFETLVSTLKRTPSELLLWADLQAVLAERRSPLLAQAIEAYVTCHANSRDTALEWPRAMLARLSGDRSAIARAFAKASTRGLTASFVRVAAAMGWLDEIVDGLLSLSNRQDAARCVLNECWSLFDDAQRARTRPLFVALHAPRLDAFVLAKLAEIATPDERVALARALAAHPVRTQGSMQLPGILPQLLAMLGGQRGIDVVAEQLEREIDRLL